MFRTIPLFCTDLWGRNKHLKDSDYSRLKICTQFPSQIIFLTITRGLELFTHTTIEATSDAIIIAQQDDSHSRSVDAAGIELIIPFTLILRRRLRREVRELEASLVRMKDQYQACSVKIYSRDQMGVGSIFFFIFKLIIAFLYIL